MPFPTAPSVDIPPPDRRLALKIDVDTLRGAQRGVPALVDLLRRTGAGATFLFALGPDRTGRALQRIVHGDRRRGSGRPSAIERYGFTGLMYGTLLPAPLIGARAEASVRAAAEAGFEVGLRPWMPHTWANRIRTAEPHWILNQMQRARERFEQILGVPPRVHGASGWQMNRHAFRLTQRLGFDYCSDTRGHRPYVPVLDAEIIACPQVPTTLPTLDELLADASSDRSSVDERMLAAIAAPAPEGHVLNISADCEGTALLPVFERLLDKLLLRGTTILSLQGYLDAVGTANLPRHCVEWRSPVAGHLDMAMQFKEFLA